MNAPHPHTPDTFVTRVLARIDEEKVLPRPRWEFLFTHYTFWAVGVLAVLLGAASFAAIVFEMQNAGWRFASATHTDFVTFLFDIAPFVWVIALGAFVGIGYVTIRHTKRGYRYPLSVLALGAVLTSMTLGFGLYAGGFGAEIDEVVGDHPPFYRPILLAKQSWWVAPEKGLLAGTVLMVTPATHSFSLRDFSGKSWQVDSTDIRARDLAVLLQGGSVRVVGVATTTGAAFHACFVFPWEVYGKNYPPPPPPRIFTASSSERIGAPARSDICKGIRPYAALRTLDENGI